MTFNVILEHFMCDGSFMFLTIEDCLDLSDCVDYVKQHYPDYNIETITEDN